MVEYQWIYKDCPCMVRVNNNLGFRMGYAGIPVVDLFDGKNEIKASDIKVHGGVTYADYRIPETNIDDMHYYWIGFDCWHVGDAADPQFLNKAEQEVNQEYIDMGDHVWTKDEVIKEVNRMVDQIVG